MMLCSVKHYLTIIKSFSFTDFRMKRNLQEGIASETLRAQSETERKEKEEAEK